MQLKPVQYQTNPGRNTLNNSKWVLLSNPFAVFIYHLNKSLHQIRYHTRFYNAQKNIYVNSLESTITATVCP